MPERLRRDLPRWPRNDYGSAVGKRKDKLVDSLLITCRLNYPAWVDSAFLK